MLRRCCLLEALQNVTLCRGALKKTEIAQCGVWLMRLGGGIAKRDAWQMKLASHIAKRNVWQMLLSDSVVKRAVGRMRLAGIIAKRCVRQTWVAETIRIWCLRACAQQRRTASQANRLAEAQQAKPMSSSHQPRSKPRTAQTMQNPMFHGLRTTFQNAVFGKCSSWGTL